MTAPLSIGKVVLHPKKIGFFIIRFVVSAAVTFILLRQAMPAHKHLSSIDRMILNDF